MLLFESDSLGLQIASKADELDGVLRFVKREFGLQSGNFLVDALLARLKRRPARECYGPRFVLGSLHIELFSQIPAVRLSGQEQFANLFSSVRAAIGLLLICDLLLEKRLERRARSEQLVLQRSDGATVGLFRPARSFRKLHELPHPFLLGLHVRGVLDCLGR